MLHRIGSYGFNFPVHTKKKKNIDTCYVSKPVQTVRIPTAPRNGLSVCSLYGSVAVALCTFFVPLASHPTVGVHQKFLSPSH